MQSPFFACGDDLRELLADVESRCPLKYTILDSRARGGATVFDRGDLIPHLGIATGDQSVSPVAYLVSDANEVPIARRTGASEGFDQLMNPNTVEFRPGGEWANRTLISGRVATASDSEMSAKLMKLFRAAIKRRFTRVNAFAVGPRALALLDQGWRLTCAVQSPPLYDLHRLPSGNG